MPSTVTLQNTINWTLPFLNYAPVTIGTNNEPAITSANTILQTILSPPFNWRWNRKTVTFTTTASVQDYIVSISNYGHFEVGSVTPAATPIFPLEYKTILTAGTEQSRPKFISDQIDDDSGNITFRLLPVPDTTYTVTVTYQAAPVLFTSLSQTWDVIPDWLEFVYNWGFLATMSDFIDQSKAPRFRQLFVGSLLSTSEGLSESEKNLFISSWLGDIRQETAESMGSQVAWKGRSV